jgi:hypothetical protein
MTYKYNDVFQCRLFVSLKSDHIDSESVKSLFNHLHQLEFIRILESYDASKMTTEIIASTMAVDRDDEDYKECAQTAHKQKDWTKLLY